MYLNKYIYLVQVYSNELVTTKNNTVKLKRCIARKKFDSVEKKETHRKSLYDIINNSIIC